MKILFYYRGAENLGIGSISACLKEAGNETDLIFDSGLDDTFYSKFPLFKKLKIEDKLVRKSKKRLFRYNKLENVERLEKKRNVQI